MNSRASFLVAGALTAAALAAAAPDAVRLSGAQAATQAAAPAFWTIATADLKSADGRSAGSVTLNESPRGVLLQFQGVRLPPGLHGVHFHAKGDCSDSKFERAGGHTHSGEKAVHGLLNPVSTDTGDLSNVRVAKDGALDVEVFSAFVSLNSAVGRQDLLDADGSAIVLHANADDHRSQPIGGAGARIACGVIKPAR